MADAKPALNAAWVNSLQGTVIKNGGSVPALDTNMDPPALGDKPPASLEDLRQSFQQQQQQLKPPKPKWYKTPAFIQTAIVVGVFIVVFILLVSIQPPFLNTRPSEEDNVEPKFSAGNAAWFAFASSAVCGIIFAVLAILAAKKKKQALKAVAAAVT